MLLHPVIPMCSVTSSPESLYAWVWLTSLNILWPKKLLGWDFMEYKSHYTLKKTLRILSVNKMYDFLDAWILGQLFYQLILFHCPSISYAYVWWRKVKWDVFGEMILLSFHDCTLTVETTRYLEKAHGILIISKIFFFRWVFSV